MKLAPLTRGYRLFVATVLPTFVSVTCIGQEPASELSKAVLGQSMLPASWIGLHQPLTFLKTLDTPRLTAISMMAISLIAIGMITIRLLISRLGLESEAARPFPAPSIRVRALWAAALAGCIMWAFEISETVFYPHVGIWASLFVIIVFAMLLVAATSFSALKREERLRHEIASSEDRYKVLFERSLTGAYRTTLDGCLLDCNVSFCQMFGYEAREEMIGRPINAAYFNTSDRDQFIEKLRVSKSLTNFEQRLRRKDGSDVWVLNSATLVAGSSGSEQVIKGTMTDISELRQSEQEHRRLAAIVRCSDDAILSLTMRGVIETWNEGAERLFGYSAEDIIGKSINILAPVDRSSEYRQILAEAGSSSGMAEIETIRVRKDGHPLTVAISVSSIRNEAKEVVGAAAILRDITAKKQAEEALHKSELQYRLLFDSNPFPMWVFDRSTLRFLAVNRAAIREYGFTEWEFLAMTIADIRPEEDIPDLIKDVETRTHGLQRPGVWRHRKKNGAIIDVEIVCHHLDFQAVDAMLVAAYDITERKQAEEALSFKTALLEAQAETGIDGILAVDESDHIILVNRQFGLQFEVPDELLNSRDDRIVLRFVEDRVENPGAFLERVQYLYGHRKEKSRDEFRLRNGKSFERYSAPLLDSRGEYRGRIWYFHEITGRKLAEERIQFLAYFDALTGLPNRILFKDRLENSLAAARRRDERVAVLSLDIDRFKNINDSLGHNLGDLLLKDVAERLKGCTREQDLVARVGGDEFIIVLTSVQSTDDVAFAAARILKAMTERFVVKGHSLSTSCSLGISMFPDHGMDVETLIKYADQAMSCAKEDGRNSFRFFNEDMNNRIVEQMNLESDLRKAIERGEFFLVYQPQIEIGSGRIIGMEALIRWQHPQLGIVLPNNFIPIAEKTGLILPIGEWVLRTSCSQTRRWQEAGLPKVSVAVNVSAVQFRQEGFCTMISRVLHETGLSPEYLELELTESLLLSNEDVMFSVLQELQEMGLTLAIDDFGTGYSSLSYLKHFPVNKLKIDRSFISDIATDSGDAAITTAIIFMAKSMNLKVIAEGVENEEQMSFLQEHQCDEVQGYLFSKPVIAADVPKKLFGAPVQHRYAAGRTISLSPAYQDSLLRVQ